MSSSLRSVDARRISPHTRPDRPRAGLSFAPCRGPRPGRPPARRAALPSATGSPGCSSPICRRATTAWPRRCRSGRTAGGAGSWSPGSACRPAAASWTWPRGRRPSRPAWPVARARASWGWTRARRCSGRAFAASGTAVWRARCGSSSDAANASRSPTTTFDAVTFTYLLRYVDDPAATLAELTRVLRPGGTLANLEFLLPPQPVWRAVWSAYTRFGLPAAGAGGVARVGRGRALPRAEHPRLLPAAAARRAAGACGARPGSATCGRGR